MYLIKTNKISYCFTFVENFKDIYFRGLRLYLEICEIIHPRKKVTLWYRGISPFCQTMCRIHDYITDF